MRSHLDLDLMATLRSKALRPKGIRAGEFNRGSPERSLSRVLSRPVLRTNPTHEAVTPVRIAADKTC